jgi:hypothetical protein
LTSAPRDDVSASPVQAPRRGIQHRKLLQLPAGLQGLGRLAGAGTGGAGQLRHRRALPGPLPRPALRHPVGGQGLEHAGDALDRRRLGQRRLRLLGRQQGGVEPGGVAGEALAQLRQQIAHGGLFSTAD